MLHICHVNMPWMFDGIFETSKALKTFASLLPVSLTRNFSNIFDRVNCIEANVVWRAASGIFREKLRASIITLPLFPLLRGCCLSEFNSIFNSFILPQSTCLPFSFLYCILHSPNNTLHKLINWKNYRFQIYPVITFWEHGREASYVLLHVPSEESNAAPAKITCLNIYLGFKYSRQQIQILRKVKNEIYADWILGGRAPVLKWPP